MSNNNGVLYVGYGEDAVKECNTSCASLKKHMRNLPAALVTNHNNENIIGECFDQVIKYDKSVFSWDYRIEALRMSPFNTTLHLDADTYICSNITELFTLTNRFDLAAAHAPNRHNDTIVALHDVPHSFPQFNCGVILFKKNKITDDLMNSWLDIYIKQGSPQTDQPAFRKAVYNSNVRFSVLTPEYNCRFARSGFLQGEVKILHGRNAIMSDVDKILNEDKSQRVHVAIDKSNLKVFKALNPVKAKNGRIQELANFKY